MDILQELEDILGLREWSIFNIVLGDNDEKHVSFDLKSNIGMCTVNVYNFTNFYTETVNHNRFYLNYTNDLLEIVSNGFSIVIRLNDITEFYLYEM